MTFDKTAKALGERLSEICPRKWDGKKCIKEMQEGDSRHWKQMEWIGFYFQFICDTRLHGIITIPGPRYGKTGFDGFAGGIPWDFKAHAINTSSHLIIVNDSEATARAVAEYGAVGLILAMGEVVYNDEARTFQEWHDRLKGETSKYVHERIARGAWSRLRKVSFYLKQISFIRLTDDTLIKSGSFQSDFRNSNGNPRRAKVLIDLEKLDDETFHFVEF
jgi:hypothetical protein